MAKLRCLVVDDEELARNLLQRYIEQLPFLDFKGGFANPLDAMAAVNEGQIDLVFLDIQMPQIRGTDLAKLLPPHVGVIFTTAYGEYALEGFELSAVDYLLKPITFERFAAAVNKAKARTGDDGAADAITVKSGYDLYKLNFNSIYYIQSDSEYVIYHTKEGKIMSNQSLTKLADQLPASRFMRVHRSYVVNLGAVTALKGRDLLINDMLIPVSARYFDQVKETLFGA